MKIGVTQASKAKVTQRLRQIQCDNHEAVELLGVLLFETGDMPMRQAEQREQELHREFAAYQLTQDGHAGHEWFGAETELLAYIGTHAIPPEKAGYPRTLAKP